MSRGWTGLPWSLLGLCLQRHGGFLVSQRRRSFQERHLCPFFVCLLGPEGCLHGLRWGRTQRHFVRLEGFIPGYEDVLVGGVSMLVTSDDGKKDPENDLARSVCLQLWHTLCLIWFLISAFLSRTTGLHNGFKATWPCTNSRVLTVGIPSQALKHVDLCWDRGAA